MQKIGFDEALDRIVAEDRRYDREAYLFLRDALDYTIKSRKKQKTDLSRHVTGPELLEGVRQYALGEFGPMVPTVFELWGLKQGLDIGEMVFNLVKVGIFGKTDTDQIEDFRNCYDFHEAFVKPYLPPRAIPLPLGAEPPDAAAAPAVKTPRRGGMKLENS